MGDSYVKQLDAFCDELVLLSLRAETIVDEAPDALRDVVDVESITRTLDAAHDAAEKVQSFAILNEGYEDLN